MNNGANRLFALLYGASQDQQKPYAAKVRKVTSRGIAIVDTADGRKLEIEAQKGWKRGMNILVVPTIGNPVGIVR